MGIKSLQTLVQEALKQVKTLTPEEALQKSQNNACSLIDIRDLKEELLDSALLLRPKKRFSNKKFSKKHNKNRKRY